MSKFLQQFLVCFAMVMMPFAVVADDYQLPDPGFEDWSGSTFDGKIQPKYWHASNVSQSALGMTFNFNFANRETGRNGGYCIMAKDQEVGAAGITEISPSYYSLGYGWQYLEGLSTGTATAGTKGGYAFAHRPDTVSIWIKRTGDHTDDEDFHVLYYAWTGTAKGSQYKNKNSGCTSTTIEDEESDIRIALDGNECKTDVKGNQVAEAWWREKKKYSQWTNLRIPVFYFNNDVPTKCNLILSASNYPAFRANNGLFEGNALYVDDVELIYSSKIHKLYIGDKEWKGFDPNSTEVQYYSLGETATSIPSIEARRGNGSLTNIKSKTVTFPGRVLSGSEITIVEGDLDDVPTTITVKSEDGKSTTVYRIQFQRAKSNNAKLASISVNGEALTSFSASKYNYTVELPYGTTDAPIVAAEGQEDKQTISINQATSTTGTATITVTAADGKTTATYTLNFKIGLLADNTLKDILVNGSSVAGFTPTQTIYKVSLPVGTSQVPEILAVSNYPEGEQTIEYVLPTVANLDGGSAQIKVSTPGNTTPKIYKLNFKLEASSYSYLKDLQVGGTSVSGFAPMNLTYYINLPLGTTALPAITWTKGDDYQTVTKEENGIDGTTRITVVAGNGDKSVYKLVFSTEKSERSTLNGIKIDGVALEGFDPDVTNYTYQLPIGTTTVPDIEPIQGDEFQNVVITKGNVNGTTRITVTAGNGNTTIYLIAFTVDSYTINTLKSIKVDGVLLAGFDPEVNEYSVKLPQGTTTLPEVTVEKDDENLQTVTTRNGGVNGDYRITVRPQSGASRTYIIHFSVETSENTTLTMIRLDGKNLEGFDPEINEYYVTLPEGVSTIPTISYDKAEANQRVLSVLEDTTQIITVTAQSGAKREYKIHFRIQLSANAFLKMIYLDGDSLDGFEPQQLTYNVMLAGSTCPKVTVDKEAGQQVTITTPVGAGDAKILVAPEQGAPNTYIVTFKEIPAATVQLQDILVNGVSLAGFDPKKKDYTATYEKELPTVNYVTDVLQSVNVMWVGETVWLHVNDADGNKAAYSIEFTRVYKTNADLASIKADGVQLADWSASKKLYTYELTAGSTYPTITYEKADPTQVVVFGQIGEGAWKMHVTAENGDTTSYVVRYTVKKNSDALLENIELVGLPAGETFTFNPETNEYNNVATLDEGAELPDVQVIAKAGQKVISYNSNENEQVIKVVAEDGTTNTYVITYARRKSSNALLADILIDGVSIEGFAPDKFTYIDTIARNAKAVPNIFPVAQISTQIITTEYCRPNGTAIITVESQDSTQQTVYTIAFPTRKSNNTELESLYAYDEASDMTYIDFSPNQLFYDEELPYQTTKCPQVFFAKAEAEQRVDFESRPLGDTTKIIVIAENGDKRTYCIYFHAEQPTEANRLSALSVIIDGDEDDEREFSLKDKTKRNFEVTLPYNARKVDVKYEKMYDEQTVFIQPGGVNNPTIITVKANRGDEADEVYTITPIKTTQNPAILNSIKVDGVAVEGFDPNRFTYIVNRSTNSYPKVVTTKNSGVETEPESSMYKWQCTVSKDGATNVYTLFFHYVNEVIPNSDFTQWETAQNNNGAKPTGWQVPADFFEKVCVVSCSKTGSEVVKTSNTVVGLETTYWSAAGGALPAIITLGKLSGAMAVDNKTHYEFYDYIDFHNTPDAISVNYKHQTQKDNGAFFAYRFKDASNDEYSFDFTDKSTSSSYKTETKALTLDGKQIVGMNIAVDATNKSAGASSGAKLYVDWFKLSYNSTPKAAKANGIAAVLSNKIFTVTLTDPEDVNMPSYEFNGEVSDQAQKLTWVAPVIDGNYSVRKATLINYAEDGTSTTGYSLHVKRPLDTRNTLSDLKINGATITGFAEATENYTIHLAPTVKHLPDVIPVPKSSLQTVTTSYADSTMTITVSPEKGSSKVYTVRFVTDLSGDTELATLKVGTEVKEPTERNHSVTATTMPDITFTKKSDLQKVVVENGVVTVIAENGAVGTYVITRNDPAIALGNAQLKEFEIDNEGIQSFGNNNYTIERARPSMVSFVRHCDNDHVVFVQTPTKMEWQVTGNESHTYTLNYPSVTSSNTNLSDILLNGVHYDEFSNAQTDYTSTPIYTDGIVLLTAVAAEKEQKITIAQVYEDEGVTYTIDVKAADNVAQKTYKLRVERTKSDNMSLAGILVDGEPLTGFSADKLNYTITLPSKGAKTAVPQMPSISYLVGQAGQKVELTPGAIGELDPTIINVTNEKGNNSQEYSVTVLAEPSHCAELTGIMINGEALTEFEPGRHYYSKELNTENIFIQCAADDRFLHVDTIKNGHNRTLHVTAEDGTTTADYFINIYVQSQSSDATLSNILLEQDGTMVELVDFQRALNSSLRFEPMQHSYEINLPAGSTMAPAVSAQLKMDGQQVEIQKKNALMVVIKVTAVDGTPNEYTLNFVVPKSKNANLGMIFIDGDSLQGFKPDYYFYQIDLPVGVHSLPNVDVQKAEARQTVSPEERDRDKLQVVYHVAAEDTAYKSTYTVLFRYTRSDADSLLMVYADGDSLRNFNPQVTFYNDSLPVGTTAFPEISWTEADEWQEIKMDTLINETNQLMRQIIVTSESGRTKTYTFTYTICKSSADTLQMIYVDTKPLEGFIATKVDYQLTLSAAYANELNGALPNIEYLEADTAQTVIISQAPDSISGKSLGYKSLISVTAASGKMRIYTIHYNVEQSSDASLNMIMLAGKPISGFDSQKTTYRLTIDARSTLPAVTVVKKEEAQTYEMSIHGDSIIIDVRAEDGTMQDYVLAFTRELSDNAQVQSIKVEGHPEFLYNFLPNEYDYLLRLPYGEDTIPAVTVLVQDTLQTVMEPFKMDTLENGDVKMTISVVAPNGTDEADYTIIFKFVKNNDATLKGITIGDQPLNGFQSLITEYDYAHPYGSTEADFFTVEDVTYLLSDTQADASISLAADGVTIMITVTAQDGTTEITYLIRQYIALDSDNALSCITLDNDTIRGFDSDITFYTYLLMPGITPPAVAAESRSQNADVSIREVAAGDTCLIICTAADGSERRYYIHFAISSINESLAPTGDDVVIKRLPGMMQLFVGTIRQDVYFGLFDQNGNRVFFDRVPMADPNDVELVNNPNEKEERLNDVIDSRSGLTININPNQVYFYSFYYGGEKTFIQLLNGKKSPIIKSGKLVAIP